MKISAEIALMMIDPRPAVTDRAASSARWLYRWKSHAPPELAVYTIEICKTVSSEFSWRVIMPDQRLEHDPAAQSVPARSLDHALMAACHAISALISQMETAP